MLTFLAALASAQVTVPWSDGLETEPTCSPSCGATCILSVSGLQNEQVDDDLDWTVHSGLTTSSLTGPYAAVEGVNYAYIEASSPTCSGSDQEGHLVFPDFDLTGASSAFFQFQYHMYGAQMGTLHVDASTDGGQTWTPDIIPSLTDNLDLWQASPAVDLTPWLGAVVTLRLRGIVGADATSDMAVDDFRLTDGDADGDGFDVFTDCDDLNPATYPGATEICDGRDNDCDGAVPADEIDDDADGTAECDGDCDDANADVFPGATEECDGIDGDCDGVLPADEADADGDGVSECAGDCDEADPNTYPSAPELCDGVDSNCDGTLPLDEVDADADGVPECAGDCDDADPNRYPRGHGHSRRRHRSGLRRRRRPDPGHGDRHRIRYGNRHRHRNRNGNRHRYRNGKPRGHGFGRLRKGLRLRDGFTGDGPGVGRTSRRVPPASVSLGPGPTDPDIDHQRDRQIGGA